MRRLGIVLALVLLAVGCGSSSGSPEQSRNTLQRLRWQALLIDRYQLEQRISCFCGIDSFSVVVTVRDGAITGVTDTLTGEPVPEERWDPYYTVEGLFDLVERATAEGADSIEVEYDPDFFFPSRVNIDFIELAVDDELLVEAGPLTPLRGE